MNTIRPDVIDVHDYLRPFVANCLIRLRIPPHRLLLQYLSQIDPYHGQLLLIWPLPLALDGPLSYPYAIFRTVLILIMLTGWHMLLWDSSRWCPMLMLSV
jgi:hypothetical protein